MLCECEWEVLSDVSQAWHGQGGNEALTASTSC